MRTPRCPACDGTSYLLGSLGHTRHYRCRDCGWDFSRTPKRPIATEYISIRDRGVASYHRDGQHVADFPAYLNAGRIPLIREARELTTA